jgi:type III pantothenate kinase
MTFLVDVGNSRIKWASVVGAALADCGQQAYQSRRLAETLDTAWAAFECPDRVVVANVGGAEVAQRLSAWVGQRWECEVEFTQAQATQCGVVSAYLAPQALGADRWAALIATHHRHHKCACVVDCGTAITIDAIAADGEHLGGLITPGLGLMRQALLRRAPGIAGDLRGEVSLLARSTADGVAAGTLYAAVAVIDRVVSDVEAELGERVLCVLCGGDAETVASLLARETIHEPALVLEGLAIIASAGR